MRFGLCILSLWLSGCTLLTSFNPEGQPCDPQAAPKNQCLKDYHCENGKCVAGAFDAGR